jgi:hypothetical protein
VIEVDNILMRPREKKIQFGSMVCGFDRGDGAALMARDIAQNRKRALGRMCCAAICLTASISSVPAAQGEWRWRLFEEGSQVSLYAAADDATDNVGSPRFHCVKGSRLIEVWSEMDDQEREAISELIRKDEYPSIELVPPERSPDLMGDISYSGLTGGPISSIYDRAPRHFPSSRKRGCSNTRLATLLYALS